MKTKIRRRCKCGCGKITKPGNKYIPGHHSIGNTYGKKNKNKNPSKKSRTKMSLSAMGNTNAKGNKGKRHSKETILKRSISRMKCHPNYPYCDIWKDEEYKKDLRKDYCENIDCEENYKRLNNHHVDLDKKNCHPFNIVTLCNSCHSILHHKLRNGRRISAKPKDFLIINRLDHITYINKKTRNRITIRRIG